MRIDEVISVPATFSTEFMQWFGSSHVADGQGRPLVVYHGTTKDFQDFSAEFLGQNTSARSAALGFFFTNSHVVASKFAANGEGDRVLPVYLSIQKPLELRPYQGDYNMQRTNYEMRYRHPDDAPLRRHYKPGKDPFHQLEDWAKLTRQITGSNPDAPLSDQDYAAMRAQLIKRGFDGVICYETYMDAPLGVMSGFHNFYVALHNTQIRYATIAEGRSG